MSILLDVLLLVGRGTPPLVRAWSGRRSSFVGVRAGAGRDPLVHPVAPACIADIVADRAAGPGLVRAFVDVVDRNGTSGP